MGLYQKYRPHRFADVVGQPEICHIIRNQIRKRKISNSYLFTGPSGVGKTTIARIISLTVNCEKPRYDGEPCLKCRTCQSGLNGNAWDTVEFDAATFRGIEDIRNLSSTARFTPFGRYKVYILDEAHMLTEPAQNALLRLLEDAPEQLIVIMSTTDLSRILETVQSRCQVFQFKALSNMEITTRLETICHKEKIELNIETLRFIATMALGNLRKAETSLEQISNLNGGKPTKRQAKQFLQPKLV